jgi:hypothetical protein
MKNLEVHGQMTKIIIIENAKVFKHIKNKSK